MGTAWLVSYVSLALEVQRHTLVIDQEGSDQSVGLLKGQQVMRVTHDRLPVLV